MSVKYQKLQEMKDYPQEKIDFSSPFTYENRNFEKQYQSIFTYNDDPDSNSVELQFDQVSFFARLGHWVIVVASFLIFVLTMPISIWFSLKIVPDYKRLVVFRLGWMLKAKGPGFVFVLPLIDRHHLVDIRTRAFNVPPQQLLTVDGAAIEVGADVYLRIVDVQKSVTCVQNLNHSTRLLVQMALVKQLTQRPLDEIEKQKSVIVNTVQVDCNKAASSWGVEISRCELSLVKVLVAPSSSKLTLPKCLSANEEKTSSLGSLPTPLKQLSLALLKGKLPKGDTMIGGREKSTMHWEESALKSTQPERILSLIKLVLNDDLVKTIQAIYQVNIESKENAYSSMNFVLDLKNGCGDVRQGTSVMVDASLTMKIEDLFEMIHGQLKPLAAYMNGQLKVTGNVKAALKLDPLLVKLRTAL